MTIEFEKYQLRNQVLKLVPFASLTCCPDEWFMEPMPMEGWF